MDSKGLVRLRLVRLRLRLRVMARVGIRLRLMARVIGRNRTEPRHRLWCNKRPIYLPLVLCDLETTASHQGTYRRSLQARVSTAEGIWKWRRPWARVDSSLLAALRG